MSATSDAAVTVAVPARAEHLHVLRTVVGSTAIRRDLSVDAIEDLRIAVDEACTQLLHAGGTTLEVRVSAVPGGIVVSCTTDASVDAWPPADGEQSLAMQVLEGLTDEVRWERDEEGAPAIRIFKRSVGS